MTQVQIRLLEVTFLFLVFLIFFCLSLIHDSGAVKVKTLRNLNQAYYNDCFILFCFGRE